MDCLATIQRVRRSAAATLSPYSFVELHGALGRETRSPVPVELPGKRSVFATWSRSNADREDAFVRDRQTALEQYLRQLCTRADAERCRQTHAFADFLAVPVASSSRPHLSGGDAAFTTSSWLDEQDALHAMVRSARADISRRDALAKSGDANASQQANVEAKKKLAALLARLSILAKGLDDLAVATAMPEGEVRRRADMVTRLQDEAEALGKSSSAARSAPDLLGTSRPISGAQPVKLGRTLGAKAAPVETDATRPLDNQGLLQLQQEYMTDQDARVSSLSAVVRRQRELALSINRELGEQNELIDGLSEDVDRVGSNLKKASAQLKKLGS